MKRWRYIILFVLIAAGLSFLAHLASTAEPKQEPQTINAEDEVNIDCKIWKLPVSKDYIKVYELQYEGHYYIITVNGTAGGIDIVHSESCGCHQN